jgi:hypothetical protein
MNDIFEYHLEKAVKCLLKSGNIDPIKEPEIAKLYIKERIFTMVNNNINQVIDNLLSK